jgi:hypothetical protein
MTEANSSQPHFHIPESDSSEGAADIRERAARLQAKVADLSKTFDHIEQTLDEAAGDRENSKP